MRRGRRPRRTPQRSRPENHAGRFTSGPFDPPTAFKSGWKAIRLAFGIGSTDVDISTQTIKDTLSALGIAANSVKVLKLSAWVLPGVAANQTVPRVIMSVRDPVTGGTLGTREDTGLLSRSAHVHYSFSDSVRGHALDLPDGPQDSTVLAKVSCSAALGDIQASLLYNI